MADWPPVQHPPGPTPLLDAALIVIGALILTLVAALVGNVRWMVIGGTVALLALIAYGWLENH